MEGQPLLLVPPERASQWATGEVRRPSAPTHDPRARGDGALMRCDTGGVPPIRSRASRMVTFQPSCCKWEAADSPATPEQRRGRHSGKAGCGDPEGDRRERAARGMRACPNAPKSSAAVVVVGSSRPTHGALGPPGTPPPPPPAYHGLRFWFRGQKCRNTGSLCSDKPVSLRATEHMLQT